MPTRVAQPTHIPCAGTKPKLIDEYIGRVNSQTTSLSIAHMRSPEGVRAWTNSGIRRVHGRAQGHLALTPPRRRAGCQSRAGGHRPWRRMGAVFHSAPRRGRVHRSVSARVRNRYGASGRLGPCFFPAPDPCPSSVVAIPRLNRGSRMSATTLARSPTSPSYPVFTRRSPNRETTMATASARRVRGRTMHGRLV
jgi:hypothetical protein